MKNSKKNLKKSHNSLNAQNLLSQLDSLFAGGKFRQTVELCRQAITNGSVGARSEYAAKIYFTWVLASMKLNDYKSIDKIINLAQRQLGTYLDLQFIKVMAAKGKGDHRATLENVEIFDQLHRQIDLTTDTYLKQSHGALDEVLWIGALAAGELQKFEVALEYMERALSLSPGNHPRRTEYANLLAKEYQPAKALVIIDEGITLYPNELGLRNARGALLGELERFEEAEAYFKRLLQEHPENTDAINNLGVIYDKQGYYELAKNQFKKLLELDPNNEIARQNLDKLCKMIDTSPQKITLCMMVKNEEKFLPGCLESVKGLVDEIIIVDTGSTDATMEIARRYDAKIYEHPWQNDFSLHRNQSIGCATGDWILILDADEELMPSEHREIRAATARKDIDSIAMVVYNKISSGRVGFLNSRRLFRNNMGFKYEGIVHNQLKGPGKTLGTKYRIYHHGYGLPETEMRNKAKRTEALLMRQLEEDPAAIFSHFNLAQIYRGTGEYEKSLEHADFVVKNLDPNDQRTRHVYAMALDQKGCALSRSEKFEEAEVVFNSALEYKKDYLDPIFNLGYTYMQQQRYDEAEKAFHRYLQVKENYIPHLEWLGIILNNFNSQFAVYYCLGLINYLRHDIEPAFKFLCKSLEYTEDFEYLHHLLARCYRSFGDRLKTLEHCAKAVEFGHEDADIRLVEGEAYLNLGDAEKARSCFNRALGLRPEFEEALLGLVSADSLAPRKSPLELLAQVERLLEKSPTSPQGLAARGDILFQLGDFGQALISYKNSAERIPDDYKVLNNLGNCFLKENNYASAVESFRTALEKNADFISGYRNLGIALIKQQNVSEAIEYLEHYLSKKNDDTEVHATLGDLYYNNKEYTKAIAHYECFLKVNPRSLEALIRLSDCYLNLGKFQAAAYGYQAALGRDSSNPIAKQRLDDLNQFLKPVASQ